MAKKRQPIPEFKRPSYFEPSEQWPYSYQSLSDCVLEIYQDANPKRLEAWQRKIDRLTEAQPILFMAMVCGVVFRISRPDVTKALEDLWKWLTGGDRYLDDELAKIVIEVLTPQMAKVIEARGYKRGWPKGEYIRKKGRPPVSKGAWVTALLAEKHFRDKGLKAIPAKKHAVGLAAVLLGRKEIELSEFYRTRKNAPKSNISELTRILTKEHEHWVKQDKLRWIPERQPRYEELHNLLPYMGCEGICRSSLYRIPNDLWQPFWDI